MRFVQLFLGAGFLVFGGLWVSRACAFIKTAARSSNWPRVHAQITQSVVLFDDQSHRPNIEYAYEMNGATYIGSEINVGVQFGSNAKWAESVVTRYPVGRFLSVAVDPRDPSSSVLEPGIKTHMYVFLLAGIGMVTLGLVLLMVLQ